MHVGVPQYGFATTRYETLVYDYVNEHQADSGVRNIGQASSAISVIKLTPGMRKITYTEYSGK